MVKPNPGREQWISATCGQRRAFKALRSRRPGGRLAPRFWRAATRTSGVSSNARAFAPIPAADAGAHAAAKGTTKNAPVLIRAYKKEAELEIWKQQADGRYVYVKTFPMCRWSGQLGPKVREGDRQVPEGFYTITPGSDEPELGLLPVVQRRLSQRL